MTDLFFFNNFFLVLCLGETEHGGQIKIGLYRRSNLEYRSTETVGELTGAVQHWDNL